MLQEGQIRARFFHLFCNRKFPVTLLSVTWLLHIVVYNGQSKAHLPNEMKVLTALDVQLYSYSGALMSREAGTKRLNIVQNAMNSTKAGMVIQLVT